MIRRDVLRALTLSSLACTGTLARAQAYPSRPVTLLVGGAPGSVPDIMVRPIAERLSVALGHPVVVENRPGAAGSIAISALLQSAPDGHTLALATMSQAVFNTYLFAKLPYDPLRDLEPVTPLVTGAMALAAHPSFPAQSLGEFVTLAKAQPGKYFVAIPQSGSPPHIVALLLRRTTGIDVTMVPHKSGSDAVSAVVSGEIPLLFDAPTIISNQVRGGRLKVLAVTGRQREPSLPECPTANEAGFDVQGEAWIGLVAPRGTPGFVVQRLHREVGSILAASETSASMARLGFRTMTSTPEAFRTLIQDEHRKWSALIRDAGLRLE
jgi:tripartite-type tricarboxylate transporter receptor subunit TctC